jgi:hypothetical protein
MRKPWADAPSRHSILYQCATLRFERVRQISVTSKAARVATLTRASRRNRQAKRLTRGAVQGATEQFLRIDSPQTLILGDPVKLEPIGEALRHNTIAILNGQLGKFVKSRRPFANTVETAQVARLIPARLGPPHTFFRLSP